MTAAKPEGVISSVDSFRSDAYTGIDGALLNTRHLAVGRELIGPRPSPDTTGRRQMR